MTIPVSLIKPVLQYAADKGVNSAAVFSGARIDPSVFDSADARLTLHEMDLIYQEVMVLTGDEHLGLHVGECFTVGSANIVGYIFMNCRTIGDVLTKLVAYNDIITEGFKLKAYLNDDTLVITLHVVRHMEADLIKVHVECIFSACMAIIAKLIGERIRPVEVRFQHKRPHRTGEHQRIFQSGFTFENEVNAMVFDKDILDIAIPQPNQDLLYLFEEHANRILNDIRKDKPFTKKVSLLLVRKSWDKLPTIEKIAQELSMSVRNLQKKLKKENTSYRIIFNDVYKKIAFTYLNDGELSIAEIAYIMGFSEPSAFHRSFKRWTGVTPKEFRESTNPS